MWRRLGSPRVLGLLVLFSGFIWFLSVLKLSQNGDPSAHKLQKDIVSLSKQYVHALAQEDRAENSQGEVDGQSLPRIPNHDLSLSLSIVLENILQRLTRLEAHLQSSSPQHAKAGAMGEQGKPSSQLDNDAKSTGCMPKPEVLSDYPHCLGKINWMKKHWKSDKCYADHGVDGSDCSYVVYLSEVERWCPRMTNESHLPTNVIQATTQTDVSSLLALLKDPGSRPNYAFIRMRIQNSWKKWVQAASVLPHTHGKKKKILLHLGLLSKKSNYRFAEDAFKGGPLGEMVQWSDLISSLHVLGHELIITSEIEQIASFINAHPGMKTSCQSRDKVPFELIFIDITGLYQLKSKIGAKGYASVICLLRVLDSFGTQPDFNFAAYARRSKLSTVWGGLNLNTQQFFTMFFHTPDNSFMGFVVDTPDPQRVHAAKKKDQAVVYGKNEYMWEKKDQYLNVIHESMQIHGTVGEVGKLKVRTLPKYVINHGVLSQTALTDLLLESKVFVGLGFPYEGPAPLEAIASGCVFINPIFNPPHSRRNTKFFQNKPTFRVLKSQHPYAADFIGKPYVYTVNMNNREEVDSAIHEVLNRTTFPPFLPYEFSHAGMLERLSAYITHQNFCPDGGVVHPWIPPSDITVILTSAGTSCINACSAKDLVCEPSYFKQVNTQASLELHGVSCSSVTQRSDVGLPAINMKDSKCTLQAEEMLFGCSHELAGHKRLCPCRTYINDPTRRQHALCKNCI